MYTHSTEIDIALHLHEDILELYASGRLEPNRITHQALLKHPVSVDANALARLFETTEPVNGSCEIQNTAGRDSEDSTAPQQADQRSVNLRQVLLNIKSRRAKA